MEKGEDTGFKDKSGRNIHVDDVIQYRLGKYSKKSGGPTNDRVVKLGKKYRLTPESSSDVMSGVPFVDSLCRYIVVINCRHIPD